MNLEESQLLFFEICIPIALYMDALRVQSLVLLRVLDRPQLPEGTYQGEFDAASWPA